MYDIYWLQLSLRLSLDDPTAESKYFIDGLGQTIYKKNCLKLISTIYCRPSSTVRPRCLPFKSNVIYGVWSVWWVVALGYLDKERR